MQGFAGLCKVPGYIGYIGLLKVTGYVGLWSLAGEAAANSGK